MTRPSRAALALVASGLALAGTVVTASAETLAPVTPGAPVVSDESCGVGEDSILLPESPGAAYSVTVDGETIGLPTGVEIPGALALAPIFAQLEDDGTGDLPELPDVVTITIEASAQPGYLLADGAQTAFEVSIDATPCDTPAGAPLVVTSPSCEQISVTNPAGNPDAYLLGADDIDSDDPEADVELSAAAGETVTAKLPAGTYTWVALDNSLGDPFAEGAAATRLGEENAAVSPDPALPGELRTLASEAVQVDRHELTDEDLGLLQDLGDIFDAITGDILLDEGEVTVAACEDKPVTPVIPTVVQTDGGPTGTSPTTPFLALAAGLLGIGGLTRRALSSHDRPSEAMRRSGHDHPGGRRAT